MSNNILYGTIAIGAGIGGYFLWKKFVSPNPPPTPGGMDLLANTDYYVTFVNNPVIALTAFGSAWNYYDSVLYYNESIPEWVTVASSSIMLTNGHYAVRFTQPVTIYGFVEWAF